MTVAKRKSPAKKKLLPLTADVEPELVGFEPKDEWPEANASGYWAWDAKLRLPALICFKVIRFGILLTTPLFLVVGVMASDAGPKWWSMPLLLGLVALPFLVKFLMGLLEAWVERRGRYYSFVILLSLLPLWFVFMGTYAVAGAVSNMIFGR